MNNNLYIDKNIKLDNVNCYISPYSKISRNEILSGNFYISDNKIINDRIKIYRIKDRPIGWISIYDIIDNESISIGSKVIVNGNLYQYADGSGDIINISNREMYIVDIIKSDEYYNTIGIGNNIDSDRLGFTNIDNIRKYIER